MEGVSGGGASSVNTEDEVWVASVAGGTSADKGQVGTLQATGLLFRPLAHGVSLHFVSCIDLPSGSRALRGGCYCVVLVTVTALGDLWSHQLMLSPMPVCPFYDKVVLAVVGCSGVGALLHCMYSVVALRPEALCY